MWERMTSRPAYIIALVLLAALTLGLPSWAPGGPAPAQAATVQAGDVIVEFGDPVHIGPGESVETVVSFGGDVTIEGTVRNTVVAFGGDVDLRPGASVGWGLTEDDHAIVTFGGTLHETQGATVLGKTFNASDVDWGWAADAGETIPFFFPFGPGSAFGWTMGFVVWAVFGLILVAVAPRQLNAVAGRLESRPAAYLGWGALEALVIFPLATVLMIVTIIGILVAVPWAIFIVPALFLFGYVAAAGAVGARLLDSLGDRGDDLLLATIVGLAAFKVIGLIPILGTLALLLVWLAGLGATVSALWNWQRNRRTTNPAPVPTPERTDPPRAGGQDGEPTVA